MTLVAALSGCDGSILFADTQETVAGYSKKTIDKLVVCEGSAFRLGIAGASEEGMLADMLQSDVCAALCTVQAFDKNQIIERLTETLTNFYAKHIWPRPGERPHIEYLLVIQPLSSGYPMTIHVTETAANIVREWTKTIGVGSYLADYLFKKIMPEDVPVGHGETLTFLCSSGVYVAKEVRENIEGVGQTERIAVFNYDGTFDEIYLGDILQVEENLLPMQECLSYFYQCVMDAQLEDELFQELAKSFEDIREIRSKQVEWYKKWLEHSESRKRLRKIYKERGTATG